MADKINEAKQFLQKQPPGDGASLYEHLSEVLLKILVEKPSNAAEVFEHISSDVKALKIEPKPNGPVEEDELIQEVSKLSKVVRKKQLDWASKTLKLFKVADEPPENPPTFPDLMDEANMWEWAGVSFGRTETYRLYLSVKTLAESLPGDYESLRFWGKITTRTGDYYIVEGKTFEDKEEMDPMKEEGKDGANKYTYWVTKSYVAPWSQLPHVTMEQIVIARKIRRFFTGDLDAPVSSYPPFPGTEKELLRAQIARITHGTCVSPAGFFELDEESEEPEIKFAEAEMINESFPKPVEEMKDKASWAHHEMELNVLGRCRPMPERLDENGDPIEDEDAPEPVEPLRTLDVEEEEGVPPTWTFRCGPSGSGESPNSHVIARSLVWPGSFAIGFGKRFTNIYVGDGLKFSPKTYTPPMPPLLQKEWVPNEEEEEEPLLEMPDVLIDPNPPEEEDEDEDA
mmetsp:Transcript_32870/g.42017  ORF Transcript_32870/g.42017 Transcript_32870/m.42017 type:complete len:456 (+) Transcript_32870:135-1502(+)